MTPPVKAAIWRRRALVSASVGRLEPIVSRAGKWGGIATDTPTPEEIVSRYCNGWILFGRPGDHRPALEWRWFLTRALITPETAKVPRRLRPARNRSELTYRFNDDIDRVIELTYEGREGWLTEAAVAAYKRAQSIGAIGSVSAYRDGQLVAGLWGISVGPVLGIISMFHHESDAGSLTMAALSDELKANGRWTLVECGGLTETFRRFGALEVSPAELSKRVWSTLALSHAGAAPAATGDPTTRTRPHVASP